MAAQHPPGAICVPHAGRADMELTQFLVGAFQSGLAPRGSVFVPVRGSAIALQRNIGVRAMVMESEARRERRAATRRSAEAAFRSEALNEAIREATDAMPDLGWVLFVDTDEDVPPTALMQLLDRDLPLVSGVVLQRFWPYEVAAFSSVDPVRRVQPNEIQWGEAKEVAAVGTGCLLIRREVIDAVGDPWFKVGQINPELLQEDMWFSLRAADKGYLPMLDGAVRVLHRTEGHVYLGKDGRVWMRPLCATEDMRYPINIRRA